MCTLLTLNICLMCHTQELVLEDNNIGDAGLTALAKAVESGALPALKELYFDRDKISNTVKATVKEVCKQRVIGGSPDRL